MSMFFKIGYVIKILCFNIRIVCISYHVYNLKYKKLLIKNKYIKVYDNRNELKVYDYILYKYYKKSKYCNNILVKII